MKGITINSPEQPKMSESKIEQKRILFKEIINYVRKIWAYIIGPIGAVTTVAEFIQLWEGDINTLVWVFAIIGLFLLISSLAYIAFCKDSQEMKVARGIYQTELTITVVKPRFEKLYRIAQTSLVVSCVLCLAFLGVLYWRDTQLKNKFVILIADFDGVETQRYRVTEFILKQMKSSTSGYQDTVIRPLGNVISEQEGQERAIELGKKYRADMVIWGWYAVTNTDTRISVNIENLSTDIGIPLPVSMGYMPEAKIIDLESFTLQQKLSHETTSFTLFISGMVRYKNEDYDQAIAKLTDAIQLQDWPEDLIPKELLFFFRGNSYLSKGMGMGRENTGTFESSESNALYSNAIKDFTTAIQKNDKFALSYSNRATANMMMAINGSIGKLNFNISENAYKYYQQAYADAVKAIEFDPENLQAYLTKCVVNFTLGNIDQNIQDYQQLIIRTDGAEKGLLYWGMGEEYYLLGEYDEAIAGFDRTISILPNFTPAYLSRGKTFAKIGEYEKSLVDINYAIALEPYDSNSYSERGDTYEEMGKYEEAISDYTYAIKIDQRSSTPNSSSISYCNRAQCYAAIGKYELAIQDFNDCNVSDLWNNFPDMYVQRGLSYQALGMTQQAESDFSKAKDAYLEHAEINLQKNNYERVIDYATKVILLDPDQTRAYLDRAIAFTGQGEYRNALNDLDQVIAQNPENIDAYFYRGIALFSSKDYDQAIDAFSIALDRNPEWAIAYIYRSESFLFSGHKTEAIKDLKQAIGKTKDENLRQQAKLILNFIKFDNW